MTKPYYQDKFCTIYHGDCLEIMPELEPVDLVLTDPPYLNLANSQKHLMGGVATHKIQSKTIGDPWQANLDWLLPAYHKAYKGFMCFCSYHFLSQIRQILHDSTPLALITWHKRNAPNSINNVPHYTTEFIWTFKKNPELRWRKLETFYDIPNITAGCVSTGERLTNLNGSVLHKTQKPLKLMLKLLAVEPDTILDPFMGSGTTLVAAKQLNRKAIGIEREKKDCEIAVRRLAQEVMEF